MKYLIVLKAQFSRQGQRMGLKVYVKIRSSERRKVRTWSCCGLRNGGREIITCLRLIDSGAIVLRKL